MKTFIVTGASGFLGSEIVRQLGKYNRHVIALDSPRLKGPDLSLPGTLDNYTSCITDPKNTVLIHTAGIVKPSDLTFGEMQVNLQIAYNMAKWCSDTSISHNIMVSSISVYNQETLYGVSKSTEEEIWKYLVPEDRLCVVRMNGILGWQRQPTMLWNRILQAHITGKKLICNNTVRDYIPADEAASYLIGLARGFCIGIFTCSKPYGTTTAHLVEVLRSLSNSKPCVTVEETDELVCISYKPSGNVSEGRSIKAFIENLWNNKPDWLESDG